MLIITFKLFYFVGFQVEIYKKAFNSFDADGSGSIDAKELQALFNSLGWSDPQGCLVDRALKYLDKDISNVVEFEEFLRFAEFSWKYIVTGTALTVEPVVTDGRIQVRAHSKQRIKHDIEPIVELEYSHISITEKENEKKVGN